MYSGPAKAPKRKHPPTPVQRRPCIQKYKESPFSLPHVGHSGKSKGNSACFCVQYMNSVMPLSIPFKPESENASYQSVISSHISSL